MERDSSVLVVGDVGIGAIWGMVVNPNFQRGTVVFRKGTGWDVAPKLRLFGWEKKFLLDTVLFFLGMVEGMFCRSYWLSSFCSWHSGRILSKTY